ncbi:hypothetical protein AB0L00_10410 [Actinoallomurus sp. NPDC052308]|uniref:WXG100 family type VII secretion target n=1 Tax=Actinoallomurus sp. NPDC052308 TaxID=3155530 RepID=UPI00341FA977
MAPSPELVANCKKIAGQGGELASEPHAYMNLAHEYTEKACKMPWLAFGIIGSLFLSDEYEASRHGISESIKGGVKQLETASQGLVKVANSIAKAEVANTVDAKAKRDPGFKYVEPSGSGGFTNFEAAGLFGGVTLAAENAAIAVVNGASATLAPTAILATVIWAMFIPDDDALSKAVGGWDAAATNIKGVTGDTWKGVLKTLDDNWKGDSHTAFSTWSDIFSTEVDQTATAAETNSKALKDIVNNLHHLQNEMFIFAMGCFAAIIAFAIGEKLPYIGPICAVLKQIQGAVLSGGTATSVAAVAGTLATVLGPLKQMFDSFGTNFAKLEPNKGGSGNSFQDINIKWASPTI